MTQCQKEAFTRSPFTTVHSIILCLLYHDCLMFTTIYIATLAFPASLNNHPYEFTKQRTFKSNGTGLYGLDAMLLPSEQCKALK